MLSLLQSPAPVRILSRDFTKLHPWLIYGAEIALLIIGLGLVRFIVVHFLRRWARRKGAHHSEMADVIAQGVTPILLILLLEMAFSLLDIPRYIVGRVNRGLNIVVLVLVLYFLSKVLQLLLNRWIAKAEGATLSRETIQFFSKVVFGIVATLLVLENLDIQLKTVWTTLGIGGVAIALALQDTLSNFFAGLYLRLDNPVQIGDYVLMEGSQEGFVRDLGWRSTRMQTFANTTVIIPNSKLATTVLINYSAPVMENSVVVHLKVAHDADPGRVKSLLSDSAAKLAAEVTGCDQDASPWIRYIDRPGQPTDDYAVIVRLCNDADAFHVERQLRERLLARLAAEHIATASAGDQAPSNPSPLPPAALQSSPPAASRQDAKAEPASPTEESPKASAARR